MLLVVDTHALIWFLEGSDRLSAQALTALLDPSNKVIVPTIVLTEMRSLYAKSRIPIDINNVLELAESDERFSIYPLDVSVVQAVPLNLNIHDAISCGTALVQRDIGGEEVRVITRDEAIRNAGIVETVWGGAAGHDGLAPGPGAGDRPRVKTRGMRPRMSAESIYHVWFATKGRRHLLLGNVAQAAKESVQKAAREHGLDLLECETMVDHVHLLLRPASMSLSWAMKLLKGRSAYEVFRRFPDLKLDAKTNVLWQRGYGAKPVPEGAVETVRRYIRTQDERLGKY